MNIFKYEMIQNKKSIIIWSISFILMISIFMPAAPLFIEESGAMKEMIANFGDMITKSLNINADTLFSEVGFYSYIFTYIGFIGAIQAMNIGLNIISKENRMKTADFLMVKPRSRTKIFLSKLSTSLVLVLITQMAFYISAYLSILVVSKGDFAFIPFVLISFTFFFIQIIFLSLGLFLAVIIPKIKSVVSVTMGFTFGTFILGMISAITESEILRYFSPLRYFDTNYIINNNSYEFQFVVISVVLVIGLIVSSYFIYINKDIDSV